MTPENNITNKTRVSIAERLVPALSYAVAAASGAIGAVMILQLLNSMRSPEMAGAASFFMATARLEAVVGTVLLVAATIGGIGILVAVIRLFTTNTKASPPGVLFLLLGLLALIPPFVVHYVTHSMEHFVMSIEPGREAIVGETADHVGGLDQRVVRAVRHRAVARRALHAQSAPRDALLADVHGDVELVALRAHGAAVLRQ